MRAWIGAALAALMAVATEAGAEQRVRIGYFPNLTHAVPIVGLAQGTFARSLGNDVAIETKVFNAGPAEIEALFAGEIDVGYIGLGPALTGYVRSKGKALRDLVPNGGASLVVRADSGISAAKDLAVEGSLRRRSATRKTSHFAPIFALPVSRRRTRAGTSRCCRSRTPTSSRSSPGRSSTERGCRSRGRRCCTFRRAAKS